MEENGHIQSTEFYESGTVAQWKFVLSQYGTVLQLKADNKKKGGKELIKLDTWYNEQLPDLIKKRPQKHLTYEEIVKVMKWKLLKGKFRPRLTDLVKTNTPLAVTQATKRGFKRMPNLSHTITALATLKGVGPAMASAVMSAGFPESAAFMSDEAMLSIPDITSIDYTIKEYLNFAEHIQKCVDRLNKLDKNSAWTPHTVEQTLWTHYLARQLEPSILDNMPDSNEQSAESETDTNTSVTNGNSNPENPTLLPADAEDGKESSNVETKDNETKDNETKDNETKGNDLKKIDEKNDNEEIKENQDEENCDPIKAKEEDNAVANEEKDKLEKLTEDGEPPCKKVKA